MTVYIAGAMTGIPFFNFPAFDAAAARFRLCFGYAVINPADMDRAIGFDAMTLPANHDWYTFPPCLSFADCVTRDIEGVRRCDAIYMLEGWTSSKGARAEFALAEWLGKKIWYENETLPVEEPPVQLPNILAT